MVVTKFSGTLQSGGGIAERALRVAGRLRFPDVHVELPGGVQLFVNIGRMNKNGTPVSRELGALAGLAKEGITVFAPYGLRK
jgi:hypothetical protein